VTASRHAILFAAALVLAAGCGGGDTSDVVRLYDHAPVPAVPDHTSQLAAAEVGADGTVTGALPDGLWWAHLTSADPARGTLTFTVSAATFTGDGVHEIADPHGTIVVPSGEPAEVTVAAASGQNLAVDGKELASLVTGNHPAPESPAGYSYQPYGFLLTVLRGTVRKANQIWVTP
jgi:hypothetical protein